METDKPNSAKIKWFLKPASVIVAILIVGPFALPLVWISPAFKKLAKVVITILVILISIWLVRTSADIYKLFVTEMQSLKATLPVSPK